MGNRGGALHGPDRTLSRRHWVSRQWICCRLTFNGRRRTVMAPNSYTELFFLDESTAFAAGHRPCFECRRADAIRFANLWTDTHGITRRARADAIDRVLHAERLDAAGEKCRHTIALDALPAGAMFVSSRLTGAHLVLDDALLAWTPAGYRHRIARPTGWQVEALTPPGIIAVLKCGYRPLLHETAFISG